MPTKKLRTEGVKTSVIPLAAALGQKSHTATNTASPVMRLDDALKNSGRKSEGLRVSAGDKNVTDIYVPSVKAMTDKVKKQMSGQKRMKNGK